MATVKRSSLPMSGSSWGTWFNNLNCPLISASGNVITIDNEFTLTKDNYNVILKKGSTQLFNSTWNNPATVTVCCSDKLVYIQGYDPQSRRFVFIYEKLDDIAIYAYYGASNTTGVAFKPISDFTFTEINTGLEYTHGARLNYTDELSNIDYAPEVLFMGGIKNVEDPNFISCSTVTADKVITFQGQNYYAVSAHTLVLIDE